MLETATAQPNPPPRAPIAGLIRQIADDATHLARSEIKLARAELMANIGELARPVVMVAVAALLGVAALFALMVAFIGWLAPFVGVGWAALIVTVADAVIALLLLSAGMRGFKTATLLPERALRSVEKDVAAVKESVA